MIPSRSRAVSPVVAVILMVAITVGLSAVIGTVVFDMGQQTTSGEAQQDIGLRTSSNATHVTASVVTGDADELYILKNGSRAATLQNPGPGDTLSTEVNQTDDISISTSTNGQSRVISTNVLSSSSTKTTEEELTKYVVEDFEDGDLSEYNGEVSYFDIVSSNVYEGDRALYGAQENTMGRDMYSLSGLEHYPEAGDTLWVRMRFDPAAKHINSKHFRFGMQSRDDYYQITLDERGYYNQSLVRDDGTTIAEVETGTLPAEEWLTVKIEWETNGDFTVTGYDSADTELFTMTGSDTTYSSGGIGFFDSGKDTKGMWDSVVVGR